MTIETKRDVFNEVRYKFRNFKNEHRHGMYVSPDSVDHYLSDAFKRYYAAFPDDLPVITKAVGKYIKTNRGHMSLTSGVENASCISEWLWGKGFDYGNDSVFARAWLLGVWRVEETGEIVKLEEEK